MPDHTIFAPATPPSYPFPSTADAREPDFPAFTSTTPCQRPPRASCDRAPARGASRSSKPPIADAGAYRLTTGNNARTSLRHAPLRPRHASVEHLPPPTPGSHSLASSGYQSNSNSNDSIATTIFTSNDSLYDAARPSTGRHRQTSEASITITDGTIGPRTPDLPAAYPAVSEATVTITDGELKTEQAIPFVQAPLLRVAVDALLADCAATKNEDRAGTAMSAPAPFDSLPAQESEPYLLGCRIHRTAFDHAAAWHERLAVDIAKAAAGLASGTTKTAIEFGFIQMSLAYSINHHATRNEHGPTPGDNAPPPRITSADLDVLDRVRQLRDVGGAHRRKLDAALDEALAPQGDARIRRVAQRIVEVVAEMANESFRRRVYHDEIEKLVAGSDGNDIDAMHRTFIRLYGVDRSFASPYQSGVDRCLALINSLPRSVQEDFLRTVAGSSQDAADGTPALGLARYRDAIRSGTVLHGQVSERLQSDLQRLMTDLFAAAAVLRGDEPGSGRAREIPTGRTPAVLLGMPPPPRPTLRDVARRLWRRIRPSTPLERAQRQVFQAIKQQAASPRPPTRSQWKVLEAAIQDVVRLQRPPAQYGDVVQACVRTLTPTECVALHQLVDSYDYLKADDPDERHRIPAERRRHLLALDAALAREPAIRHTMHAAGNALDLLRAGNRGPGFMQASEALSACLDTYAADLPEARMLCESALQRLAPPARDIRKALAPLKTLEAQARLKDDIKAAAYQPVSNPRIETISLMPALRALAAALEHQAV